MTIYSLNEPGVRAALNKIEKAVFSIQKVPSFYEVLNQSCDYESDDKNVDLATLAMYLWDDKSKLFTNIIGGLDYLKHVPDCKDCLYNLRRPLNEFWPETPKEIILVSNYEFSKMLNNILVEYEKNL